MNTGIQGLVNLQQQFFQNFCEFWEYFFSEYLLMVALSYEFL